MPPGLGCHVPSAWPAQPISAYSDGAAAASSPMNLTGHSSTAASAGDAVKRPRCARRLRVMSDGPRPGDSIHRASGGAGLAAAHIARMPAAYFSAPSAAQPATSAAGSSARANASKPSAVPGTSSGARPGSTSEYAGSSRVSEYARPRAPAPPKRSSTASKISGIQYHDGPASCAYACALPLAPRATVVARCARPPARACESTTVTAYPKPRSSHAAVKPAKPAPMTTMCLPAADAAGVGGGGEPATTAAAAAAAAAGSPPPAPPREPATKPANDKRNRQTGRMVRPSHACSDAKKSHARTRGARRSAHRVCLHT